MRVNREIYRVKISSTAESGSTSISQQDKITRRDSTDEAKAGGTKE